MKAKSKHPGGQLKARRPDNHHAPSELRKIFSPKEAKLKKDILYIRRELAREAAYEEACEEEECRELIGKFTRESAKRTGDDIGEILDRYQTIVLELLAARNAGPDGTRYSLESVLLRECTNDKALKEFLVSLGGLISLNEPKPGLQSCSLLQDTSLYSSFNRRTLSQDGTGEARSIPTS